MKYFIILFLAKEPSTYSISSDSSSVSTDDDLTHELESIWKLKSSKVTLSQEIQKKSFSSDDMLMQLLVSHAVVDSRDFKVLSFEEFEALKQVGYSLFFVFILRLIYLLYTELCKIKKSGTSLDLEITIGQKDTGNLTHIDATLVTHKPLSRIGFDITRRGTRGR
jgi:hypothetical protein